MTTEHHVVPLTTERVSAITRAIAKLLLLEEGAEVVPIAAELNHVQADLKVTAAEMGSLIELLSTELVAEGQIEPDDDDEDCEGGGLLSSEDGREDEVDDDDEEYDDEEI